jgi:hypothetical protein
MLTFKFLRNKLALGSAVALLAATVAAGSVAAKEGNVADFEMQPSAGAKTCLPNARAHVKIKSLGAVELMTVDLAGLPPNSDFDLFVLQTPSAPFGVSWYQGDVETWGDGTSDTHHFIGRFNVETFAVAPGVAPAPVVFDDQPFPDADQNPAFNPIQMYHLGLWFNSPADAARAGCAGTVTPFNGEHTAGIQVLNTAQFPLDQGPLRQLHS